MPREGSDTVAFHDVPAYFSEDEWKLLHEWQKVLYRNVMKEIHQALISLGPLIATTVCSLRAQEKEEPYPADNELLEQRPRITRSPSDGAPRPEDYKYSKSPKNTEGRGHNDCLGAGLPSLNPDLGLRREEEPISIFIDHFGVEVGEGGAGYDVGSYHIKDEKETCCMETPESKKKSVRIRTAGGGTMNKKSKVEGFEQCIGRTTPLKRLPGKDRVVVFHSPETAAIFNSQPLAESTPALGDEMCERESGFNNVAAFSSYQERLEVQRSEKYDWKSVVTNLNLLACPPNIAHNSGLYSCTESDNSVSKKDSLNKHKEMPAGVRPFQCTECTNCFSTMGTLIIHKRTHTGERPHYCTTCKKSFSQKGVLNRHLRIHLGERPYQCPECAKSFSQKGHLSKHLRTHSQNR